MTDAAQTVSAVFRISLRFASIWSCLVRWRDAWLGRARYMAVLLLLVYCRPVGAQQACVADCNGNGHVSAGELIVGVDIALGNAQLSECSEFDQNGTRNVEVDEILVAVNSAYAGCIPIPTPTWTPTPRGIPTPSWTATPTGTSTRARCTKPTISVPVALPLDDQRVVAVNTDAN